MFPQLPEKRAARDARLAEAHDIAKASSKRGPARVLRRTVSKIGDALRAPSTRGPRGAAGASEPMYCFEASQTIRGQLVPAHLTCFGCMQANMCTVAWNPQASRCS
jgi:hypothetical protein